MSCENVLLVTIDSLRADAIDFGALAGDKRGLQTVVNDGVVFDQAFASGPGTGPSFPAILCGSLPLSYGGLGPLSADRPRLAETLSDAGLATGGFHSNPFLSRFFEYDRGFDQFRDYQNPLMGVATKVFPRGIELGNSRLQRIDDTVNLTDTLRKLYGLVSGRPRPYVRADVITDDAIEFLNGVESGFFCWAHYMDVHHPCHPPEEYRRQFGVTDVTHQSVATWYSELLDSHDPLSHPRIDTLLACYRAAIAYVLDQIGRLIECLDRNGQLEETVVIITSDHGELHGEDETFGKPARLHDELLHVPLVVYNGADSFVGARTDLVSLLDIPPLVHHSLDLPLDDRYEGRIPGVDPPRELIFAEHEVDGDVIVGARSAEWRYEVDEIRDQQRVYRLRNGRAEPAEIDQHSEPRRLQRAVQERLAGLDVETGQLRQTVEGDVESRLEDLGYL